jgi:cytochrome c553
MKLALAPYILASLLAQTSLAENRPPHAAGIESKDYNWSLLDTATLDALKCIGDPQKGEVAYEVCRGCHKSDASGRPDAGYPQLAGQHISVLIKQMIDVRQGKRDNPRMHPFVEQEAVSMDDIPHVAAYLHNLPIPASNRKGNGKRLDQGKLLYDRDCMACHGDNGEGDAKKLYPNVAGQHYPYLYRESLDIRDKVRRNANTRMVKVLRDYQDEDIEAVSDYMSRLALPGNRD